MSLILARALVGEYYCDGPDDGASSRDFGAFIPRWATMLGVSRALLSALAPRVLTHNQIGSPREFYLLISRARATTCYVNVLSLNMLLDENAKRMMAQLPTFTPYLQHLTITYVSTPRIPDDYSFLGGLRCLRSLDLGASNPKTTTTVRDGALFDALLPLRMHGYLRDVRLAVSSAIAPEKLRLLASLPSLRVLALHVVHLSLAQAQGGCTMLSAAFCNPAAVFENLHTLELSGPGVGDSSLRLPNTDSTIWTAFPHLASLTLADTSIQEASIATLQHIGTLHSLTLRGGNRGLGHLRGLSALAPSLVSLCLDGITCGRTRVGGDAPDLTPEVLAEIGALHQLRQLSIMDMSGGTFDGDAFAPLAQLGGVTELRLSLVRNFEDADAVRFLAPFARSLQRLDLEEPPSMNSFSIFRVLRDSKVDFASLTTLTLRGRSQCSSLSALKLLTVCLPALRRLHLPDCPKHEIDSLPVLRQAFASAALFSISCAHGGLILLK